MKSESPQISLPKSWSKHVRAAILHVISLAQFATAHTRSWAANSVNARIRLKAERDLKTLCPTMGKVKIAQTLARAGLHLGATTVGRMLREDAAPKPRPKGNAQATGRVLTAKYRDQIWHVDLTAVPTGLGFWVPWLPFALPQQFSFCWWVGVVVDHFFRRVMGIGVFAKRPNRQQFCAFLGRTIARTAKPKYIICDRDCIFDCHAFRSWVKRKGIQPPRYGAAGKHGSIAVVERFILSMKTEPTGRILVPMHREAFLRERRCYQEWFNEQRPHTTRGGRTPTEVDFKRRPATRRPRVEPRRDWPRGSPCAKPQALVAGKPGDAFAIRVEFQDGRRHLPVVSLKRAA